MIIYLHLFMILHLTSSSNQISSNNTATGPENADILEKVHGNILCRSCGNGLAYSSDLISKHSSQALYSFQDSLFNTDDVLVQVFVGDFILNYPVILTSNSNCAGVEKWEESDSWFPGYRWKPCLCPDCGEYIGWVFESIDYTELIEETHTTFFGLILSSLISESCNYYTLFGDWSLCGWSLVIVKVLIAYQELQSCNHILLCSDSDCVQLTNTFIIN